MKDCASCKHWMRDKKILEGERFKGRRTMKNSGWCKNMHPALATLFNDGCKNHETPM